VNNQRISFLSRWQVTAYFACFLLAGCASELPALVGQLNAESSCCSEFSELTYTSMPTDDELEFSVGPGDQVYLFPSGKSYFKGFRMPEFDNPVSLEIRTYLVGQWIPTAHVFAPYVTVLDESFSPIGDPLVPELFHDEGWFDGSRWTGIVTIPSAGNYIVIHTAPELVNKRITLGSTDGYAYTTGTGTTYVPASGQRSSSLGVSGNLKLRFLPTVR